MFSFINDNEISPRQPIDLNDGDVILEIENGKAKVEWGEERNPSKYRGKVYQNDKLGLNSNDGRVEGFFKSIDELVLNKDKTFTNNNDETISC